MEAEDKAGFAVQNEPEIVFLALYFNHGFIGVPLVRVEIQRWNELNSDVLKHRGRVHQLLMVLWETWIYITVRKIRAMLRKEFLPR